MNLLPKERIFWSGDGWYINLRSGDEATVSFVNGKRLPIRAIEEGSVAGPFMAIEQLQSWFERFLQSHSRPREADVLAWCEAAAVGYRPRETETLQWY